MAYQTDDARAALEAYADGVNAWLKLVQTDAKDELAAAEPIYSYSVNAAICTPSAGETTSTLGCPASGATPLKSFSVSYGRLE